MLHYLVSLGLSVVNLIVLVLVYKFRREAGKLVSFASVAVYSDKHIYRRPDQISEH